jgi:7,8-dihydropterin-6-yl-methyl-4-(beta-D-ribofuranosyl)aminobenzene 5'-phosphate synthase
MHVESRKGDQTRNVLVDFGFTSKALNNDLELLGVDRAIFAAGLLHAARLGFATICKN